MENTYITTKKVSFEHMPIRDLFQRFSSSSRPISRILSGASAVAIISLGCAFPHSSCGLPGTLAAVRTAARETSSLPPLQERLYPCLALLPIGVTWPLTLLRAPVVSYTGPAYRPPKKRLTPSSHLFTLTQPKPGGLFLWPYPAGCPTPGITRHRALRSADFPQPRPKAGSRSPGQLEGLDNTINPPK
jgi:hypothetical protein